MDTTRKTKGLQERLQDGGTIVIAEGYLLEFERRGYLKAGGFVPEVVIEHPNLVRTLHEEFVHAGSDVVEAFTYYGNREKLRSIGREDDLEKLNKTALRIAREVADETGTLMAGNICVTGVFSAEDKDSHETTRNMFIEQVKWAVEGGCDFIIAETFGYLGEAMLALEVIKEHAKGIPAVVTLTAFVPDVTLDKVPFPDACRMLELAGAAAVGLNCTRGPNTMLPLLREIRKVCQGPIAALPVPMNTTDKCRTMYSLKDPQTGELMYPENINGFICNRKEVRRFAKEAKEIGVQYIGLCCGDAANLLREIAEEYDRTPPSSRYAPDMSNNIMIGEAGEKVSKEGGMVRRYSLGDFTQEELESLHKSAKKLDIHHEHE
ncbi:betaine--homocysteine S-methyltransferase 1-like [Mercenaria mercenaria]|uniref:betaine--homocysteine S-methyltransferase 1-like n=1 Tax=Mercenaria mercenaria TaxID=6596 RepID=UPI00234F3BF1|nr:betaine--homocysteine S-methyltransferase 1-like [Mercenaria mercenaria]